MPTPAHSCSQPEATFRNRALRQPALTPTSGGSPKRHLARLAEWQDLKSYNFSEITYEKILGTLC